MSNNKNINDLAHEASAISKILDFTQLTQADGIKNEYIDENGNVYDVEKMRVSIHEMSHWSYIILRGLDHHFSKKKYKKYLKKWNGFLGPFMFLFDSFNSFSSQESNKHERYALAIDLRILQTLDVIADAKYFVRSKVLLDYLPNINSSAYNSRIHYKIEEEVQKIIDLKKDPEVEKMAKYACFLLEKIYKIEKENKWPNWRECKTLPPEKSPYWFLLDF